MRSSLDSESELKRRFLEYKDYEVEIGKFAIKDFNRAVFVELRTHIHGETSKAINRRISMDIENIIRKKSKGILRDKMIVNFYIPETESDIGKRRLDIEFEGIYSLPDTTFKNMIEKLFKLSKDIIDEIKFIGIN